MKKAINISLASVLILLLAACSQKPAEIHYGSDECAYCRMMISDARFAAQVITEKGKAIKFDSIECMANYVGEHKSELKAAKQWVSNFNKPGNWLEAGNAILIQSEVIKSPMGRSLLAVATREAAKKHVAEYPGEPIEWQRLVK